MGEVAVRVLARARRDHVEGERNGRVLVRLTAPPVDGAANAALCRLIAERAGVPRAKVQIARGKTSRDKVVRVAGVEAGALRLALLG
jgi:uncharacterized protein (TIGR00251 family)